MSEKKKAADETIRMKSFPCVSEGGSISYNQVEKKAKILELLEKESPVKDPSATGGYADQHRKIKADDETPKGDGGDGSTADYSAKTNPLESCEIGPETLPVEDCNKLKARKDGAGGSTVETFVKGKSTLLEELQSVENMIPCETPSKEKKKFETYDDFKKYVYEKYADCLSASLEKKQLEADASDHTTIASYDLHTMCRNATFLKYFQQVKESQGFDFDEYPGMTVYTNIYPMLEFERHPNLVKELEGFASMAIKKYFGDDGIERSVKIEKVNGGGCRNFHYYITFKVCDDGKEDTFQAEVVKTLEKTIKIPLCRPKAMGE